MNERQLLWLKAMYATEIASHLHRASYLRSAAAGTEKAADKAKFEAEAKEHEEYAAFVADIRNLADPPDPDDTNQEHKEEQT